MRFIQGTISYANNTLLLVGSAAIYIMWWLGNWKIYNDMGTWLHQLRKTKGDLVFGLELVVPEFNNNNYPHCMCEIMQSYDSIWPRI